MDESISVLDGKDDKKRNQRFRINSFNTTSRVTVKGKYMTLFTGNDLPKILSELSKIPHFSSLKKLIAEACRVNIQSLPLRSKDNKPGADRCINKSHCIDAPSISPQRNIEKNFANSPAIFEIYSSTYNDDEKKCHRGGKSTWPDRDSNPGPSAQKSNTLPRRYKSRFVPQGSTSVLYTYTI